MLRDAEKIAYLNIAWRLKSKHEKTLDIFLANLKYWGSAETVFKLDGIDIGVICDLTGWDKGFYDQVLIAGAIFKGSLRWAEFDLKTKEEKMADTITAEVDHILNHLDDETDIYPLLRRTKTDAPLAAGSLLRQLINLLKRHG